LTGNVIKEITEEAKITGNAVNDRNGDANSGRINQAFFWILSICLIVIVGMIVLRMRKKKGKEEEGREERKKT